MSFSCVTLLFICSRLPFGGRPLPHAVVPPHVRSASLTPETTFGRRFEEEGIESRMFHGLLKESQELLTSYFYIDYVPIFGWVDKLTGLIMGRFEGKIKVLDGFYENVVDEHIDPKRQKLGDEEDIIDALLQLKNDRSFSMDLTPDHIKPIIMNLIVGGADTSAAAIVWAMTALMKHPRGMQKVQEKVRNLFGGKGFIEENDIKKLPYLN